VTDGQLILVAGALLATGLLASLVAVRVRVPSLVLFLGLGMAVGSDGLGWIDFDDYELARTIGVIALALILFEGGLTAGLLHVRPVLGAAISLATVGTLLTALIAGLVAAWLFDFSTLEGLLLGAVLSSTDGAAIFALLRGSTLNRRLARTLEAESGFNDPVAVLLVLGFIEWLRAQADGSAYGVVDLAELLGRQLGIGLGIGLVVGWLAVQAFRRARLASAGLYPVGSLAFAAIAYGAADTLHGSGFLAVYLAGLALGSAVVPAKQTVANFHQGLSWVAQLGMFLTLGLLVFPKELGDVALEGTVLALVVVFVARPLATAIATAPFGYSGRERVLLGWAGLRGAVPVVLATFPVIEHVPRSDEFFNIVFFAVVLSTLLQGSTFEALAHRLGLTTSEPALPRPLTEAGTIRRLGAEVLEYPVAADDAIVGSRVRDLGLPRDAVVNVIVRGNEAIPPRGTTRLRAGDRLHLLIRSESARQVHSLIVRWRTGPIGRPPRPPKTILGRKPIFSVWRWTDRDGDPARPVSIAGQAVVDRLRIRRDQAGGLWVLADGRYALTGPLAAVGARQDLSDWAGRRIRIAGEDERAWMQTVIAALAIDLHD
jgi:potassium/hydrogen antiporter